MNLEKEKARRAEIAEAQDAIVGKAEEEQRQLTPEEIEEFSTLQTEFRSVHEQVVAAETQARNKGLLTLNDGIRPTPGGDAPELRSVGEQFVSSEQYQSLRDRGLRGSYTSGQVEVRTLLDSGSGSGGDWIYPDQRPGIQLIRLRRLTVADLIPGGSTDSNLVQYLEETTATNAADTVTEGAAKQESTIVGNVVSEAVQKIATFMSVTDEMLEDVAQLRSYLNARLTVFVQLAEEDQLLNGTGTPPDISGILDRAGLQTTITVGAASPVDSVYGMVTAIRANANDEPDGMVINPTDWGSTDFRLAKDQNDQYYAGGPFTGPYGNGEIRPDSLWGLRVVVTSAIAAGTVLVGAFSTAAQIFRKGGITVEASNSHSDYFQKNKTAIRAEERLALAVYRPASFGVVDLTP